VVAHPAQAPGEEDTEALRLALDTSALQTTASMRLTCFQTVSVRVARCQECAEYKGLSGAAVAAAFLLAVWTSDTTVYCWAFGDKEHRHHAVFVVPVGS
jgi:hypothetical protein